MADLLTAAAEHHKSGRFEQAEQAYRTAVSEQPENWDALTHLGDVLSDAGKPAEAEEVYRQVVTGTNDSVDAAGAYDGLAAILQDQGRVDEAIAASKRSAELRGDADDAYVLGTVLDRLNRPDDAIEVFGLVTRLRPSFAEAWAKIGTYHLTRSQWPQAVENYKKAADANPEIAEIQCNLAVALEKNGEGNAALKHARLAVEKKPELVEGHNVLGLVMRDRKRPADAAISFRKALEIKPGYAEAANNLASVLESVGKYDEAGDLYLQAVRGRPTDPNFHQNLALNRLLRGDWTGGWAEMEYRRFDKRNAASRQFSVPMWDGSSLSGKTILLHAEQGIGDTIQFLRYAPVLHDRGATVVVECQSAAVPIAKAVDGVSQVVAQGDVLPTFDVHSPLMSLPLLTGTTPTTVPGKVPYVTPDPSAVAEWAAKLPAGRKVGLVWAGNPNYKNDKKRSMPGSYLAPLAGTAGVTFVSLQKNKPTAAPDALKLVDHAAEFVDFGETAAVIANLDLVIAVDTAVAHLSAAMGKPTWILLPEVPDWRWMLGREDSPWYPTVRLFRQSDSGDWNELMSRVATALRQ